MVKNKSLFLLLFIGLIWISFYLYISIYDRFTPIYTHVNPVIAILMYVIVVLPLMGYLADKITRYLFSKGLGNGKNFTIFVVAIIIVPMTLYIFQTIDDHREKSLDKIIQFNAKKVEYAEVDYEWYVDDVVELEALNELVGQYRIKKIEEHAYDPVGSKEEGFDLVIHKSGKPVWVSIYENVIMDKNKGYYYEVLDGPIDMEWFDKVKTVSSAK